MSSPKRRLELSQQAKEDFRDILSYTLTTWGESQLAKYRASINDALHVILQNPSASGFVDCNFNIVGMYLVKIG
jgi:plasmid stabilization system protein ParE